MGHMAHLRKQFKSINTYFYIKTLIKRRKKKPLLTLYEFIGSSFKGRGPGINSSQSKNVGKIQLSMQLSHLSIIFENIWF